MTNDVKNPRQTGDDIERSAAAAGKQSKRREHAKTEALPPVTPAMLDAAILAAWEVDPQDWDTYHTTIYRAMAAHAPEGDQR